MVPLIKMQHLVKFPLPEINGLFYHNFEKGWLECQFQSRLLYDLSSYISQTQFLICLHERNGYRGVIWVTNILLKEKNVAVVQRNIE